jgi:hypothetical protein
MTESQFQIQVAKILDDLGWFWYHVPNEGKRNEIVGRNLKRKGMKAGVSDCMIGERWRIPDSVGPWIWEGETKQRYEVEKGFILKATKAWSGKDFAVELKIWPNKRTKAQIAFHECIIQRGGLAAVCYTIPEVFEVLRLIEPLNGVYSP